MNPSGIVAPMAVDSDIHPLVGNRRNHGEEAG